MANKQRKVALGPAIGESLKDFPFRLCFELEESEGIGVAFSSDCEGIQQLAFTNCPYQKALVKGKTFCADIAIPYLDCEAETVIWMTYGEGVQGKYVKRYEFWRALGYAYAPSPQQTKEQEETLEYGHGQ